MNSETLVPAPAGTRLTFDSLAQRAQSQGFLLVRSGKGYELGAGEKLPNLSEVERRLDELKELADSTQKFCEDVLGPAVDAAKGTWVHVMLTATNGAGKLDRRRCLETRSNRRAAKKAMFQQAKKLKMLGVIPGLGTEYAAPRKGGGSVTISLVECSGEVNVCKGQCQGPVLEARPKPVDLGAIAAGAAPHAAAAGGGLARKGSLTRGGTAAMAATIAALALGGAGGGRK